jgi:tRNA (cytidine/uridine-2'-O-)-methyltransferase
MSDWTLHGGCVMAPAVAMSRKLRRVGPAVEIAVTGAILVRLADPNSHPRCRPPAPLNSYRKQERDADFRQRKNRSPPTWGRSEATHSGGVLLAPLQGQRKSGFDGAHNASCVAAIGGSLPGLIMHLALYQPDIPQNAGTILRLCACFGLPAHIIEPAGFPSSDRAFRRAGMDYLDAVAITRHASWRDFEAWRGLAPHRLVLFTTGATLSYLDYGFRADDVLLFGRESAGVPEEVHAAADARLRIPMRTGMRSLNVAITAALAVGEALRQTGEMRD